MLELDRYVVDKPVLSLRGRYLIQDENGRELGVALKKAVTDKVHVLMDDSSEEFARIRPEKGFRRSFMIFDAQGQIIAIMKQKLLKFLGNEFWFEDPFGDEKWRLIREFGNNEHLLYDNEKLVKARISKIKKTFGHKYAVRIESPSMNRLLVLAATICVDLAESSSSNS